MHDVYAIFLPFLVSSGSYISAAGGVWRSFEMNSYLFKYGVAKQALPLLLNGKVCVYNWTEYDKRSPKKTDLQAQSQLLPCLREDWFFRSAKSPHTYKVQFPYTYNMLLRILNQNDVAKKTQ